MVATTGGVTNGGRVGHFDPAAGHCGAIVASEDSTSSGFGEDEIVSSNRETMTNPAMTAPTITIIGKQSKFQSGKSANFKVLVVSILPVTGQEKFGV
jgi:hypothetical protein